MWKSPEGLNNGFELKKETHGALEERSIETIHSEKQKEKEWKNINRNSD